MDIIIKSQYATDENLKHLANAETVFVHRTFHTCPEIFSDLHCSCLKNGQQFLLVYCLLPDKTHSSYQRTFTFLKEKAKELSCLLIPICNHVRLPDLSVVIS